MDEILLPKDFKKNILNTCHVQIHYKSNRSNPLNATRHFNNTLISHAQLKGPLYPIGLF